MVNVIASLKILGKSDTGSSQEIRVSILAHVQRFEKAKEELYADLKELHDLREFSAATLGPDGSSDAFEGKPKC